MCLITKNTNQILSFGDDKTEVVYHAFVQIGLELKHFKDITYQDSVLLPSDLHSKSKLRLFDEEITDFGITTVGVIVHKVINLTNPGDSTIIISNIISSGINFHCSISYEEKLPSKEHTSFNIYFLPTTEEPSIKGGNFIIFYFTCAWSNLF
ncbi:hypothetical protein Mgra_00003654 [Meloidogyne graminicola]|uniref:Uncharacterized protein n=1 Tax=Meloidogyne graminicola TaxID=189291 RepID=A0A8S9ZUJ2_9BILA|nr:hypothetical protein Mgra_00003654 [Meloidogyne graminicola]